MFQWISANIGTIVISIVLIAIIAAIIISMIRDKKKGKSVSCGGDCSSCRAGCMHKDNY